MSVTVTKVPDTDESGATVRSAIFDITLDSSYAAGGEPVLAENFGVGRTILGMEFIGGNAASALYKFTFDTTNLKILAAISAGFTPAGTVAAPTFTGDALAAHRHSLFVATGATDATGARVNAATNSLAMNNAAATVAGIAAASGSAGGVVDGSGGTPTGTNSAPAFTGTARTAAALVEASGDLSLITIRARVYGK